MGVSFPAKGLPADGPRLARTEQVTYPAPADTFRKLLSAPAASGFDQSQQLLGLLAHQRLAAATLDVQPHERLRVGAAQVEPPLREFHREPVGQIDAERIALVLLPRPAQDRFRIRFQVPVDLAADREK